MSAGERYLVVHGHFYQPPRENPWVGAVEMQPSAWPHHDWNERVHAECYAPNAFSRLLDSVSRIRGIVNNYAWFSFNFGPTLLSWIEEKHPDTYARILEGDRLSRERLGHGNAMAQVYNHVIMPLATREDKLLQIRWGIRDFERRFGRRPEGMWLAETAVDMETAVCLIEEGIRFTVLAPTQAERVRPLAGGEWRDVSGNDIDPKRPYRLFPLDAEGSPLRAGHLDVFFYDGPISHGVGFEHLLTDAHRFAERIQSAFDPALPGDQLVSVCTDGESYGHHEAFADMCAAYLFQELCPRLELQPVNFAWYLERHPPEFEVRLKNAYSGGTAWSCAHGVGRWKEDCGCSTGGQPGWNQAWRVPLRAALDALAAAARPALDRQGPEFFRDWPAARSEAIAAWDLDPGTRAAFWERHLKPGASRTGAAEILDLLRGSQYMYTSCGWFFSDLTGIETAQVLKYAARVLQLLEERGETGLRREFLACLEPALASHRPVRGDAFFRELEKETLPAPVMLALGTWAQEVSGEPVPYAGTPFHAPAGAERQTLGSWTLREYRFADALLGTEISAWLALQGDGLEAEDCRVLPRPPRSLRAGPPDPGRGPGDAGGGWLRLEAGALPADVRARMAAALRRRYWAENGAALGEVETRLDGVRRRFEAMRWPVPGTMTQMLQIIENFHLVEETETGVRDGSLGSLRRALGLARRMRASGGHVHLGPTRDTLQGRLLQLGKEFLADPGRGLERLFAVLDLIDALGLTADRTELENHVYPLYRNLQEFAETGKFTGELPLETTLRLLNRLNFNVEALLPEASAPSSEKAGTP